MKRRGNRRRKGEEWEEEWGEEGEEEEKEEEEEGEEEEEEEGEEEGEEEEERWGELLPTRSTDSTRLSSFGFNPQISRSSCGL